MIVATCLVLIEIFSRECDEMLKQLRDQHKFVELVVVFEFMASDSFRTILDVQFDLGFESFKMLGKERYPEIDWDSFNTMEARGKLPFLV